jgi:glycerol-3-phosphate dehydrogenase (NAD(P)+)
MRCAVIGGGAWGTALADLLVRAGHDVVLWAREADVVEHINETHANPRFLSGVTLERGLRATSDIQAAVRQAAVVVHASPSHVLREVIRMASPAIEPAAIQAIATKGIEPESLLLMGDVVCAEVPRRPIVAVSGPSFAIEVARRQPTAVVAASDDPDASATIQRAFSTPQFRVYTSRDVKGVEVAGAVKNVMAVATGIAEGLGLGLNSRAALITRGLAETTRLGIALGAEAATFAGLAGLGDLVLTCTGALSRNRAVGVEVGAGRPLDDVLAGTETVAEGVRNARSTVALAARAGVTMPIAEAVHRVLFESQPAGEAIAGLMQRELRAERDQ